MKKRKRPQKKQSERADMKFARFIKSVIETHRARKKSPEMPDQVVAQFVDFLRKDWEASR
jgi:hypothetical protein